jgi:RNA polymerase sigma-70 factor (ECF subfamily)
MDDGALVRAMLNGEERAFDEFFETNFDRLFRFAARHVGNAAAAEDIAQRSLVQSIRKLHTWRGDAGLFTWLCAICRREISSYLSQLSKRPDSRPLEDHGRPERLAAPGGSIDPEQAARQTELASRVHVVLDLLPHRYGDVLEWKYLEGASVAEIASRLGLTPKAAESMLTRARDAFRERFGADSAAEGGVMKRGLLVLVALALTVGCGTSSPTSPEEVSLGRQILTDSYEFRLSASDHVDATRQDAFHTWATQSLGVTMPRRIIYNKYRNREHLANLTGQNVNGFANGNTFEIHTIWPFDNHEVVHLYSSLWGRAVALWSEGFAVAHQTDPLNGNFVPRWSGRALHDHARQFLADDRLIPIGKLLTTADFRGFDPDVTYPESGSFMQYVLGICGLNGVQRLFALGNPLDDAAAVRDQFEATCGSTVDRVEADWRAMLAR